jgi:hypothetical protein
MKFPFAMIDNIHKLLKDHYTGKGEMEIEYDRTEYYMSIVAFLVLLYLINMIIGTITVIIFYHINLAIKEIKTKWPTREIPAIIYLILCIIMVLMLDEPVTFVVLFSIFVRCDSVNITNAFLVATYLVYITIKQA